MKFQRIIEAVYGQPLDITVGGFESVDAVIRLHLAAGNRLGSGAVQDGFEVGKTDFFGTPLPDMLQVDEDSGLALIGICGPLLQHASLIEKSCGACSYQDIERALDEAMAEPSARTLLLNFDSPGGQHCGSLELAQKIARIAMAGKKQIFAFTEGTMASAAYCLAAGCNGIFSTKTASVGCIGSLIAFMDFSEAFAKQGVKAVVFASGKYKGTGLEGTSLTQEQADYLMGLVNTAAGVFKAHVREFRQVNSDSMQGQIFFGEHCERLGLVDGVVRGLDEVKSLLC